MATDTTFDKATTNLVTPVKKKSKFKRRLYFFIFLLLLAGVVYFLFFRPYSTGYREGYVNKLSRKGLLIKTYEGELIKNLLSASTSTDVFKFSVSDKEIAKKIESTGQRTYVRLTYNEYLFQIFFKGDTKYFIYDIKPMDVPYDININNPVTNQPR
jgi:hypothetical protein